MDFGRLKSNVLWARVVVLAPGSEDELHNARLQMQRAQGYPDERPFVEALLGKPPARRNALVPRMPFAWTATAPCIPENPVMRTPFVVRSRSIIFHKRMLLADHALCLLQDIAAALCRKSVFLVEYTPETEDVVRPRLASLYHVLRELTATPWEHFPAISRIPWMIRPTCVRDLSALCTALIEWRFVQQQRYLDPIGGPIVDPERLRTSAVSHLANITATLQNVHFAAANKNLEGFVGAFRETVRSLTNAAIVCYVSALILADDTARFSSLQCCQIIMHTPATDIYKHMGKQAADIIAAASAITENPLGESPPFDVAAAVAGIPDRVSSTIAELPDADSARRNDPYGIQHIPPRLEYMDGPVPLDSLAKRIQRAAQHLQSLPS